MKNFATNVGTVHEAYTQCLRCWNNGSTGVSDCTKQPSPNAHFHVRYTNPGPIYTLQFDDRDFRDAHDTRDDIITTALIEAHIGTLTCFASTRRSNGGNRKPKTYASWRRFRIDTCCSPAVVHGLQEAVHTWWTNLKDLSVTNVHFDSAITKWRIIANVFSGDLFQWRWTDMQVLQMWHICRIFWHFLLSVNQVTKDIIDEIIKINKYVESICWSLTSMWQLSAWKVSPQNRHLPSLISASAGGYQKGSRPSASNLPWMNKVKVYQLIWLHTHHHHNYCHEIHQRKISWMHVRLNQNTVKQQTTLICDHSFRDTDSSWHEHCLEYWHHSKESSHRHPLCRIASRETDSAACPLQMQTNFIRHSVDSYN